VHLTKSQIETIILIAFDAGNIALKRQKNRDFDVKKKLDNSDVTSVDIEISEFLRQKLTREFPYIPIICEEGALREIDCETFWLIDPIDGTTSFINGDSDFAINIALIENKIPIFGLISAPVFEGGKLVFLDENNLIKIVELNCGATLQATYDYDLHNRGLRIIASRRVKDEEILSFVLQFYPDFACNFSVEKLSSSVKFIRLLEKKIDLFLGFRKTMEWDTAAGQALLEAIGGSVKTCFLHNTEFTIGENLLYKKPNFENDFFVGMIENIKIQ
jgi:3'(2'), 5'-bisphosphate nucleotidase